MIQKKPYYPNLAAEISRRGIKKKDIAGYIGITPKTFDHKLRGKSDFRWSEVVGIHTIFSDIPAETLFMHDQNHNQNQTNTEV